MANLTTLRRDTDETYGEDYFMNGVGSCYKNFRYIRHVNIDRAKAIVAGSKVKKNSRILDFGCGLGPLTAAFNELGYSVVGLDKSEWAITHCLPEAKGLVFGLDQHGLSVFKDKSFDLVVAKDVFEHIPKKELPSVASELLRLSDKLMFIVPVSDKLGNFICQEDEKDTSHITRLTKQQWLSLFPYSSSECIEVLRIVKKQKAVGSTCILLEPRRANI